MASFDTDLAHLATADLAESLQHVSIPSNSNRATFANWAKTFHCRPDRVYAPSTVEECRRIVEYARREGARLHPVGVGHSPSDLACTNGWQVRMQGLSGLIKANHEKATATFYGGTILHDVHASLSRCSPPLALPNIGSISDQTIGGLISTASHGSGITYPVLSKHVKSLRLILPLPGAPIVRVSPDEDEALFTASLCGLGATGLIVEIEIEVEDAFRLRETKSSQSVELVLENLDEIRRSAEHVRVWWYPDGAGMVVGRANRVYEPPRPSPSFMAHLLGFHITQFLLLISRLLPSFTPYVGRWAWWLAKDDSEVVDEGYKVLNFDCLFPQYALEWAIDAGDAKACLSEMKVWLDKEAADPKGLRVHFPIEIRWTCADDIHLSPSYGRDTCWIGVVTYRQVPYIYCPYNRPYGLSVPYRKFHERFAELLAARGGRPHWAKQHDLGPTQFALLYPRFDDFRQVIARVDPQGVLRNEYVRRHIEGEDLPARLFKERQ